MILESYSRAWPPYIHSAQSAGKCSLVTARCSTHWTKLGRSTECTNTEPATTATRPCEYATAYVRFVPERSASAQLTLTLFDHAAIQGHASRFARTIMGPPRLAVSHRHRHRDPETQTIEDRRIRQRLSGCHWCRSGVAPPTGRPCGTLKRIPSRENLTRAPVHNATTSLEPRNISVCQYCICTRRVPVLLGRWCCF